MLAPTLTNLDISQAQILALPTEQLTGQANLFKQISKECEISIEAEIKRSEHGGKVGEITELSVSSKKYPKLEKIYLVGIGKSTPADFANHIDKWDYKVPFVCGATNLGEALRRINEGAAMIRSKGEAGTGDVSNAMMHMRKIGGEIRRLSSMREDELYVAAKELQAPYALVKEVAETGKLPVVLFTAGGIATPADAALMMQMGADGVFIGSGIFKSGDPAARALACVKATTFFDDAKVVADASRGLGEAMVGINVADLPAPHRLAERGW